MQAMEDFKVPFHAEEKCYNSNFQFHISRLSLIFPQFLQIYK